VGTFTDPASLHKYLYAEGDPVNRIDPVGHAALLDFLQVVKRSVAEFVTTKLFYCNFLKFFAADLAAAALYERNAGNNAAAYLLGGFAFGVTTASIFACA
jgi:hypothetical protein